MRNDHKKGSWIGVKNWGKNSKTEQLSVNS